MKDMCTCKTSNAARGRTIGVLAVGAGLVLTSAVLAQRGAPRGAPTSRDSNQAMTLTNVKGDSQTQGTKGSTGSVVKGFSSNQGGIAGVPGNDACVGAFAITVADSPVAFSTVNAVTDGVPHALCLNAGDDNVNQDVWLNYTAGVSDIVTLSLCSATYDSKLAVYDGCVSACPPGDAELLACDDDSCASAIFRSELAFNTIAGNCYRLRIGGFGAATGTGGLAITEGPPPPIMNDDCVDHTEMFLGDNPFDTTGATTDGLAHAACSKGFGDLQVNQDVWSDFTAIATDTHTLSMCAATFYDSKMAVYDGCTVCPPTDAQLLTCDDDGCGTVGGPSFQVVDLVAGNCYLIRLGGFLTSTGSGVLNIAEGVAPCPVSDHNCCTVGAVGCDDVECCDIVCALDPFCCQTSWDAQCVAEADLNCPGSVPCTSGYCDNIKAGGNPACGAGSTNVDCFVASPDGTPGCQDEECCNIVCAADPFCCDISWDGICAGEAGAMCGGGKGNPACGAASCNPNCFVAAPGCTGCQDEKCCNAICAADPFCCNTEWDGICAGAVPANPACGAPPCVVTCPKDAVIEDELCCTDTNGGCNSVPPIFAELDCGDTVCGNQWAFSGTRDLDWYRFECEAGPVTWTVTAEFPSVAFIVSNQCPTTVLASNADLCPAVASTVVSEGTFVVVVAPNAFDGLPCGGENNDYTATLECTPPCISDVNDDGTTDVLDLLIIIGGWGPCKV